MIRLIGAIALLFTLSAYADDQPSYLGVVYSGDGELIGDYTVADFQTKEFHIWRNFNDFPAEWGIDQLRHDGASDELAQAIVEAARSAKTLGQFRAAMGRYNAEITKLKDRMEVRR